MTSSIDLENALLIDSTGHPATKGYIPEGKRREMQTGECLTFGLAVNTTRTWRLLRAPDGSKASLLGGQLTGVDLPGLYVIRCSLAGGFCRDVDIVAFSERLLDKIAPKFIAGGDRRLVARGLINDPKATRERIAAALECETPDLAGIVGAGDNFSLRDYGGSW